MPLTVRLNLRPMAAVFFHIFSDKVSTNLGILRRKFKIFRPPKVDETAEDSSNSPSAPRPLNLLYANDYNGRILSQAVQAITINVVPVYTLQVIGMLGDIYDQVWQRRPLSQHLNSLYEEKAMEATRLRCAQYWAHR